MHKFLSGICILGFFLAPSVWAADNAEVPQTISQQDIDQIKKDNAELKKDNAEMKKDLAEVKKKQEDQATASDQDAQENDQNLKALSDKINKAMPGLENFVLAGDANIGFNMTRTQHSTFFADMSPLIIWQPPEKRLLVETAFDLGIGGADINSETSTLTVNLADISYEVCDNFIIGGGLFAVPFGQYHNHFDPPWVDKFPDDPLAFDAIAPVSEVGFYAKGVVPSGTTRWTYDLYATNGPNLITDDPNAAGQLDFDDFTDLNNNKAVGGRLGFLPFPDMEMGYSVQYSEPSPPGFPNVHALMQAADFHWKPLVKPLGGQFDLAAEWIWSKVDNTTYDPTGALGFGPSMFNNFRQGGYVSLGYRPTESDNKILRNVEFLARFDSLQSDLSSPGGEHESRYTIGVDYWFTSYCVLKTAYEFDHRQVSEPTNALIIQLGYGL